ncbi:MAG: Gfo/Idh/MocA family oxidoreductase [Lentisphaerae bacterium]|nr:Gfo/Idh/MocA family oxidoreductase [Lentisphaerota bacterium]
MSKKLKVGVIGGGSIARWCHVPGYAADPDCELTALAEPCQTSIDKLADKGFKFERVYSDYKEMLAKEDLDLVSVCTPNKYHAEMAIAALNAGCDVLLEKPIALSMEEAYAIKEAMEKNNKRVAVGFSHRFEHMVREAKAAIQRGLIGEPFMIRVRFAHMGPQPGWATTEWFYKPEIAGGGAMLDMAVHCVDIIQFMLGKITGITAVTATLRKDIKVDDNVVGTVKIGDRCMGYFEGGWTTLTGFGGIEIMGDNGSIVVDYAQGKVFSRSGVTKPDGTLTIQDEVIATAATPKWTLQMQELIAAFKNNTELPATLEDGISALKVTLAAYESSAKGKYISID